MKPALILPLAAALLGGCANTQTFRDGSQTLASYAATHAATNKAARSRYDELNRDLARVDEVRRQRTELLAGEVTNQNRAWTLAGKKAQLAIAAEGARVTPEALAAPPAAAAPIPPLDGGTFDEDLGKAIKATAALAKAPTLVANAKELFAIYGAFNAELSKLKADAAKAAEAGKAKTGGVAQAVDKAAGVK